MIQSAKFSGTVGLVSLLAFAIIVPKFVAQAETPQAARDDLAADFKDKVVLLEVNRSNATLETKSGTVVLVKIKITKLGDRYFLMGTGYDPDDSDESWYKDMTVGVPCENILRFHAMTPKQFTDYMKRWKEKSDK
jgi:hypothetical protein